MASIAITGARGRLARHFLADPGWTDRHELVPFSRSEDDAVRSLADLEKPEVMARCDFLLHLAWSTVPKTAQEHPEWSGESDLPLLRRLLETAGEERNHPVHVVFFSTGAVYGNALQETGSVESDPLHPIGFYAKSKRDGEDLIREFAEERNVPATILRVSNAYGFSDDSGPPQGVIPRLVRAALDRTTFARWGADSEKDYLHVDDLSRALLAIFDRRPEGTFNVASGRSLRLGEVISAVESVTGKRVESEEGGELDWDVKRNLICAEKIRTRTGWKPEVPFESGIERLVARMRE